MINSIKTTIKNWYSENKTLAAILIGMIGLPIVLFLVAAIIAIALIVLSFFFGEIAAAAILLMMIFGGIAGYVWSIGR